MANRLLTRDEFDLVLRKAVSETLPNGEYSIDSAEDIAIWSNAIDELLKSQDFI